MRSFFDRRWLLAAGLVAFLGCKESAEPDVIQGGADTGGRVDTGTVADSGIFDASSTDLGGSANDGGGFDSSQNPADSAPTQQGPVCHELELCCPSLSMLGQQRCQTTSAAWDEAACQQSLSLAQRGGLCLPPDHDAGVRGDAGPLGPVCSELLACCPTLQFGQNLCIQNAESAVESTCQNALDLVRRLGACEPTDAGELPDSGTSTVSDSGLPLPDAGTSTIADAG
ncbi:MAG: hypothetical protein HYV07_12070 [Deltaproteobacteria bacterium]|nr:hypothetical protein [Deltaproteobacteria bacterium]